MQNKLNVLNCKKSKVYLLAIVFPIAKATLKVDKILSQKLGVFFLQSSMIGMILCDDID